jgi:hypothetical protein
MLRPVEDPGNLVFRNLESRFRKLGTFAIVRLLHLYTYNFTILHDICTKTMRVGDTNIDVANGARGEIVKIVLDNRNRDATDKNDSSVIELIIRRTSG